MTITDLSIPEYAGPGIGMSGTCGLCHKRFDLMAEPDQYPTLPNDMGEPEELICDACQDLMDADQGAPTTATAQMTAPEFVTSVAALCGENEAAVVFVTRDEGLSYCVASEATARATAKDSAAEPALDDGDVLLGVAVISRDGTVAEYPVKVA